ncbi:Protein DA1-related 7 [Cardamine amara subsp. amara]|uniref:Protein DA1-related 7 n=1 Tax=Cardamine amara subsp. amara TaxID=228776 RepID=A0ABD1BH39_CARAN
MKWCLPCFKPSTSEDPFVAEIGLAIQVSQCEAEEQEANQLDFAIQESSRIHREQEQEEERRRTKEIEKDAQIANGIQYEEREKQISYKTALEEEEDEQITKAVKKSLKEKGKRKQLEYDQVENDKQHALMVQEESPPRFEENNNISTSAPVDEDEQRAIWESLKRNGKTKQSEDEVEEDGKLPKVNPPRFEENNMSTRAPMDEDETAGYLGEFEEK